MKDNTRSSSRRNFVKSASLAVSGLIALPLTNAAENQNAATECIEITNHPTTGYYKPLQEVDIKTSSPGTITVNDGAGKSYYNRQVKDKASIKTGGSLGTHFITLTSASGLLLGTASFRVDCSTAIDDVGGKYNKLLNTLYQTMIGEYKRQAQPFRLNGKVYFAFVSWLRDHVHTLKGMKYFYPEIKSGIDLYADFQREDGMIWDNIYTRDKEKNWWDKRFGYGNFIQPVENGTYEFHRIPVEADVEYLFVEGLYYTWKASGDDNWMSSRLDNALKAVKYSTSDVYRWSEKYKLIKRGFTIDTWDFQAYEDTKVVGEDIMVIDKDKTRFGVMFGDNTGMAAACGYLAEMLNYCNRAQEAKQINELGKKLRERLDSIAWNGGHFFHHVPEDPNVKRDFGVDQSKQVSLSNAYSLNRGISHQQCVAIIKTYQQIRKDMPATSPGEWYSIYPPFPKGFGIKDASKIWEYMNGGVTPIVGGELAHGAFEHGFETYGVDILNRISSLAAETADYLHCTYRGAMPDEPKRMFDLLSIKDVANIIYPGKDVTYQGQWIGGGIDKAEIIKTFQGIDFQLLNPDNHKYICIEVNDTPGNLPKAVLPVNRKSGSIYLLHTMTPGKFAGAVYFEYADGTMQADYITEEKIGHWWRNTNEPYGPLSPNCKKAWRSDNDKYVAFYIYGINNPEPEKTITNIVFTGAIQSQKWQILAVTLCDQKVYFTPSKISYGIPDNWGSATVVYALLEGLAGVKDTGTAFNKVKLSPRWGAAGVNEVSATVKYEASGGYVSYNYRMDVVKKTLHLTFTGSNIETRVALLLPEGIQALNVTLNGLPVKYSMEPVEQSRYAIVNVKHHGVHEIVAELA